MNVYLMLPEMPGDPQARFWWTSVPSIGEIATLIGEEHPRKVIDVHWSEATGPASHQKIQVVHVHLTEPIEPRASGTEDSTGSDDSDEPSAEPQG